MAFESAIYLFLAATSIILTGVPQVRGKYGQGDDEVLGVFYYLYFALDVWSRKVVAAIVYEQESSELSVVWLREAMSAEDVSASSLIIDQDNGAPMKGTLKACMEAIHEEGLSIWKRPNSGVRALCDGKTRSIYIARLLMSFMDRHQWLSESIRTAPSSLPRGQSKEQHAGQGIFVDGKSKRRFTSIQENIC